jgi:hypothetical protein
MTWSFTSRYNTQSRRCILVIRCDFLILPGQSDRHTTHVSYIT